MLIIYNNILQITFNNKKLEKYANDTKLAIGKLGKKRANKLKQRLDDLRAIEVLEDVRDLPGRHHELTSNRKGQWACDLDNPYRLIYQPEENPIPENENGQYEWSKIKNVRIMEIIDYH